MKTDDTNGTACGRPEMAAPHDLQIALHDDPEAEAAFLTMPYSHKHEYIDWILEARRPETRMQRIEKTVQRVKQKTRTAQ